MGGFATVKRACHVIVRRPVRFQPAGGPYETARLHDALALRPVIRPVAHSEDITVVIEGHAIVIEGHAIVIRRQSASRGCVLAC